MPKVRRHTVRRGGTTYTRQQHDRRGNKSSGGMRLRPRRAGNNAKRAYGLMKHRKRLAAAAFGAAAVTEIAAWTVFKSAGAVLFVAGVGLALLGAGLNART